MAKTILVIGSYDTKDAELRFIEQVIRDQGGTVMTMNVGILEDPLQPTDISKDEVARTGGSSIPGIVALEDENSAMQVMARGAARLAAEAQADGRIDGVIVLGGTMGTDLALDVCHALPIGVPKYIVSTVAFSPLLPPDRIAADVQMILWAGGLYGLNSICKASLAQAAGAVLGAAKASRPLDLSKPLVGMTSFGKTVLDYMVALKPELEERGYEVAVFHATGMGGRAFEEFARQGRFACVLDLAPQEVVNHQFGSRVSAGEDRMTNAGLNGIPQIVAPGCHDLVDVVGWEAQDPRWAGYAGHAHNRLLSSFVLGDDERREVAVTFAAKLAMAQGKTAFVMPMKGCHEWDRAGAPLHNPTGVAAFAAALEPALPRSTEWHPLDCHINDPLFCETVLAIFDGWMGTA